MQQNNEITVESVDQIVLELIKNHLEEVIVDEEEFLDLLKNSLSLNVNEKKRVIDAVPTLSQFQFDELQKVFKEERVKFRELAGEYPEDVKKLLKKCQEEWLQLGELFLIEKQKKEASSEDQQKIEDIKRSLWL